ncbi:MAG: hypothetical protein PHG27_04120 [Massilibacteroides sp.]|nr:hypothetical protein [Massilibacteroides sp.]
MNLLKLFQKEDKGEKERIVPQISHIGAIVSDSKLQPILPDKKMKKPASILVKIDEMKIKSGVFPSWGEKQNGSESLQIQTLANDQNRLQAISNSENGVETALSIFGGDEERLFSFLRRNMLNESFLPAYHKALETSDYSYYVNSYLALNSDANYNQVDKAYKESVTHFKQLDDKFKQDTGRFNKIRGVLLSIKEINDLKQGKTILVPGLIDDKGEKFTGYVRFNLSPKELKFYKNNPMVAINLHEKAVITPEKELKVQINQNNHDFKIEGKNTQEKKIQRNLCQRYERIQ